MTPKLHMNPLHWAAYQGDHDLVQLLLNNGAVQMPNVYGLYPVDIAGFSKKSEVILTFCKFHERMMQTKNKMKFVIAKAATKKSSRVTPLNLSKQMTGRQQLKQVDE